MINLSPDASLLLEVQFNTTETVLSKLQGKSVNGDHNAWCGAGLSAFNATAIPDTTSCKPKHP